MGLSLDDPVWDPTLFTKDRERLLRGDIARAFFERVLDPAQRRQLLSPEHFTVDGTLGALTGLMAQLKRSERTQEGPADGQGCRRGCH